MAEALWIAVPTLLVGNSFQERAALASGSLGCREPNQVDLLLLITARLPIQHRRFVGITGLLRKPTYSQLLVDLLL